MYETFDKRGKRSKKTVKDDGDKDVTPAHMYAAVEFGGDRPDGFRRISGNYGKTSGKRNEYKPEVGLASSTAGRMFNVVKDGISRYRGF